MIKAMSRLAYALENLEEKLFAAGAGSELALIDQDLEYLESAAELLKQDGKKGKAP